jgi:hypothetical protein
MPECIISDHVVSMRHVASTQRPFYHEGLASRVFRDMTGTNVPVEVSIRPQSSHGQRYLVSICPIMGLGTPEEHLDFPLFPLAMRPDVWADIDIPDLKVALAGLGLIKTLAILQERDLRPDYRA